MNVNCGIIYIISIIPLLQAAVKAKYIAERDAARRREKWKQEVIDEEEKERVQRQIDAAQKIEEAKWRYIRSDV